MGFAPQLVLVTLFVSGGLVGFASQHFLAMIFVSGGLVGFAPQLLIAPRCMSLEQPDPSYIFRRVSFFALLSHGFHTAI